MPRLSCLTCRVCLPTPEEQRDHYKGDWHIYNLKRKLTQLAPVTQEEFEIVKQKHLTPVEADNDHGGSFYCDVCRKSFANHKALDQHNLSKKHLQSVLNGKPSKENKTKKSVQSVIVEKKMESEELNESDWEEVASDEEELDSIPFNECLFCSETTKDMESNLEHMSLAHTFFIPEVEYCVDLPGLLNYLGVKIASGHCCLWCSEHGKQFGSKKSAQQHMLDKGHTKIKFEHSGESLVEFEDFYDYSSSYPDAEEGEDIDAELDPALVGEDLGFQLRLPSGAMIGHRSLFVFFRQHLKPMQEQNNASGRSNERNKQLVSNVNKHYKALGYSGLTKQQAIMVAKDLKFLNRVRQRNELRVARQNNLAKQAYFRNEQGFN